MRKLIIIGIGANSKMAYSFVQCHHLFEVIGFAVNERYRNENMFLGLPVYSLENLFEEVGHKDFVCFISLLWNHLNRDRKSLYDFCRIKNIPLTNLISPLATLRSRIDGDNIWIQDNVVIQNDTRIGSNVVIMTGVLIGANCSIGSHCFLGAHSVVAGGCTVGEQTFIGINAVIFDDTKVGKKCIIGACTAIKRNLRDFSKSNTSSDSIVIKQYDEREIENKLVFSNNVR